MTREYAATEPVRADIDASAGPVLLEFGAPWCGHCIGAQARIESALADDVEARHIKIEDGPGRPLGRSYRIKLWPTLIFLRDGVEMARLVRPTDAGDIAGALSTIKAR